MQRIERGKRVVVNLDVPGSKTSLLQHYQLFTKGKIYFYQRWFGRDDLTLGHLKVFEYDYSGKLLHSYSIEFPRYDWLVSLNNIKNSVLVFLHKERTKPEKLEVRVFKLEQGRAELVKKVTGAEIPNLKAAVKRDFSIKQKPYQKIELFTGTDFYFY